MTCDTGGCSVSEGFVIDNNMLTLPEGCGEWGQCPRGGSREQVAFPTTTQYSPFPQLQDMCMWLPHVIKKLLVLKLAYNHDPIPAAALTLINLYGLDKIGFGVFL